MKVLFLHHQQRRNFREEPGYHELFLPLCASPRLKDPAEFVYQPILRQFVQYEMQAVPPGSDPMQTVQAIMRANQAFTPGLLAAVDVARPDLIVYSPTFVFQSIYPSVFEAVRKEFPQVRLFTQLWDHDEKNVLMVWYEREIIRVSDLVSVADSMSRVDRIHEREGHYAGLTNAEAVVFLPTRPNPAIFYPSDEVPSVDICIPGSSSPFRQTIIADLAQRYGKRFAHAGGYSDDDQFLSFPDYARFIRRSRIVVNTQTGTGTDGQQIKGRTREVLACAGFLLDQWNAETERFFSGSDVVLWRTLDDLHAKIDHYLAHPEERQRIAAATHRWYMERYPVATYFDEVLTHLDRRKQAGLVQ